MLFGYNFARSKKDPKYRRRISFTSGGSVVSLRSILTCTCSGVGTPSGYV